MLKGDESETITEDIIMTPLIPNGIQESLDISAPPTDSSLSFPSISEGNMKTREGELGEDNGEVLRDCLSQFWDQLYGQ